jgi:hypothetical protein
MRPKMNVRYSIDKQRRLILTTLEGSVTFEEARDHQDRLLADPNFDASFDQLIDAMAVKEFDISPAEARILAQRRIFAPESHRAIVAVKPHIYGLARMAEVYHEALEFSEVEVFYTMDEALKWLEGSRPRPH